MWQMFAIMCAVTMMDCRTMYENPAREFATEKLCLEAAVEKATGVKISEDDGHKVQTVQDLINLVEKK